MNIVYCTDSVCYPGGIQRVTPAKANALAAIEGNHVWIVVTDNQRAIPVFPISDKVSFVDLGIDYYADDWKSKWHLLVGVVLKRQKHKRRLRQLLNKIKPDIVISTGTSEKYFLPHLKISSSPSFVREIHSAKDYRMKCAQGRVDRVQARIGDLFDFRFNIWRYDRIVLLTEEDRRLHWQPNEKLSVIPNPVITHSSSPSRLQNKTAIAVGRLAYPKNYESLIRAWVIVHRQHREWRLEIWGEGELKSSLLEQISRYHLEGVVLLKGYTDDILSKYTESSLFVCSSHFEGLPLVMLEAMSCGLPIVSYSCPCGPKDLIREGENGFLVPVGDEEALANRICRLIEDDDLRKRMGASSLAFSKEYGIERISKKWMELFTKTLQEKKRL